MDRRALARYERDLDAMFAAGLEPSVTLDEPGWLSSGRRDGTRPPRDVGTYETLIRRVSQRFSADRLARGERPVRYWDPWNEPDGRVTRYWNGTEDEWLSTVMAPTARALREVPRRSHLKLRFGACSCWMPDPEWMTRMFRYGRAHGIHFDFATWHYYGNYPFIGPDGPEVGYSVALPALARRNPSTTPTLMGEQVDDVRALARRELGYVPQLGNNEWNLSAGGLDRRQDTNDAAAFDAATLVEFQRHGLGFATFETAVDPFTSTTGKDLYGDLGLLSRAGVRKPSWWAFRLFDDLDPAVVATRAVGAQPKPDGLFTLASRSRDRSRASVLLVSWLATGAPQRTVHLSVRGLRGRRWEARTFRIDVRHRRASRPVATRPLRSALTVALPGQSVVLVSLHRLARRG